MSARTQFTETEALLLAMEDSDSGNYDLLDTYLWRAFLPGELVALENAADLLSDRCRAVRRKRMDDA